MFNAIQSLFGVSAKSAAKHIPIAPTTVHTDHPSSDRLFAVVLNMRRVSETRRSSFNRNR